MKKNYFYILLMTLSPFSFLLSSDSIKFQQAQEKQELDYSVSYFETNQKIWDEKIAGDVLDLYKFAPKIMDKIITYRDKYLLLDPQVKNDGYVNLKNDWQSRGDKLINVIDEMMPHFNIEMAKKMCLTLCHRKVMAKIEKNNVSIETKRKALIQLIDEKTKSKNHTGARIINGYVNALKKLCTKYSISEGESNLSYIKDFVLQRSELRNKVAEYIINDVFNWDRSSLDFWVKIVYEISKYYSIDILQRLNPTLFYKLSDLVTTYKKKIKEFQDKEFSEETFSSFLQLREDLNESIETLKKENNNFNSLIEEFMDASGLDYSFSKIEEWDTDRKFINILTPTFKQLFPDKKDVNAGSKTQVNPDLLKNLLDFIVDSTDYKHFIQILKFQSFNKELLIPYYQGNLKELKIYSTLIQIDENFMIKLCANRKVSQCKEYPAKNLIDFSVFTEHTKAAQKRQKEIFQIMILAKSFSNSYKDKSEKLINNINTLIDKLKQDKDKNKKSIKSLETFLKFDKASIEDCESIIKDLDHGESFEMLQCLKQAKTSYYAPALCSYDVLDIFLESIENIKAISTETNPEKMKTLQKQQAINEQKIQNGLECTFYMGSGVCFPNLIANIEKANDANGINIAPVAVTEINQEQFDTLMTGSVDAKEILAESIIDQKNPMDSLVIKGVEAAPLKFIARDRASMFAGSGSLDLNESPKLIEKIQMDQAQQSQKQKAGSSHFKKSLIIFATSFSTFIIIQEDKQQKEQQRIQKQQKKIIETSQNQQQQQTRRARPQREDRQIEDRRKAHTNLENIDHNAAPMGY